MNWDRENWNQGTQSEQTLTRNVYSNLMNPGSEALTSAPYSGLF